MAKKTKFVNRLNKAAKKDLEHIKNCGVEMGTIWATDLFSSIDAHRRILELMADVEIVDSRNSRELLERVFPIANSISEHVSEVAGRYHETYSKEYVLGFLGGAADVHSAAEDKI